MDEFRGGSDSPAEMAGGRLFGNNLLPNLPHQQIRRKYTPL